MQSRRNLPTSGHPVRPMVPDRPIQNRRATGLFTSGAARLRTGGRRGRGPIGGLLGAALLAFASQLGVERTLGADCPPVIGEWNVDVSSAQIRGRFLLNGQSFPESFLEGANFFLRNAGTGDEVYLGLSNNQVYDRRVVPGRYDVVYEHKIGREVPLNSLAIIHRDLEIAGDLVFDIDVPAVSIRGAFSLQGEPFPQTALESATIQARDPLTGARTALGETVDQTYTALLIPGTYDLIYSWIAGSAIVPRNALTAFRRNVSILAAGALNIDVPAITITGDFLINGALAPAAPAETGRISLLDPETKSKILLGQTRYQSYQAIIIPGTYDLHYERIAGSAIMPANASARFQTGAQLVVDSAFDINLTVVPISGAFLVNGESTPAAGAENAMIRLRNDEDAVYLGETKDLQFAVLVIPGTYHVTFEGLAGGAIMPANGKAVLGPVGVAGPSNFDINIPAWTFVGEVRFNGGSFPAPAAGESARIYLENAATADLVLLGEYPAQENVHRLVTSGTYRVRYVYESGVQLPRNEFAVLGADFEIAQDLARVINLQSTPLTGAFALDGGAFPAGPGQNAAIILRSIVSTDSLYLGATADGSYSTVIIPGQYSSIFDWALGDSIPRNQQARVDCAEVVKPAPTIGGLIQNGAKVNFSVTGGQPNGIWNLMTTTDLTLPLSNWTTNSSGVFDRLGTAAPTGDFNLSEPRRFFQIKTP